MPLRQAPFDAVNQKNLMHATGCMRPPAVVALSDWVPGSRQEKSADLAQALAGRAHLAPRVLGGSASRPPRRFARAMLRIDLEESGRRPSRIGKSRPLAPVPSI